VIVVVTGASSGIGQATALLAAEGGHDVALVARREDKLEEVAAACAERGAASTLVLPCDVADDNAVEKTIAAVLDEYGVIDAVLHCAGVVTYGRTEDVSAEDFAQVVSTNLLGAASVARHVVPVLRRQRQGALVLVGSLLGHIAVPEMTPYVVSKWGVLALARQLRIENVDVPGVRIVHVAPGSVDTPIYDNALDAAGGVNSPPPPTISPEKAARVIYDQIGSFRGRLQASVQTSWTNHGLVAAFRLAPVVWDRAVGPLFDAVSRRRGS
jgi:short-subunit dehydrogenase